MRGDYKVRYEDKFMGILIKNKKREKVTSLGTDRVMYIIYM